MRTAALLQHPDRLFVEGSGSSPSSRLDDRGDRPHHRGALLRGARRRRRRHVACRRRGAGRLRRGPVAAHDPRRARRVPPRPRRRVSGRAPTTSPSSRRVSPASCTSQAKGAGERTARTFESYAATGRHVPVRGARRRRPGAAASACSSANRSAWSARSSRGTARSAASRTRSGPPCSPGARWS